MARDVGAQEDDFRRQIQAARDGTRPYLSTKAAAWYLGMHHTTLYRLQRKGGGAPVLVRDPSQRPNAAKFYAITDLDAWMETRKIWSARHRHQLVLLDDLTREERELQLKAEIACARSKLASLRRRLKG